MRSLLARLSVSARRNTVAGVVVAALVVATAVALPVVIDARSTHPTPAESASNPVPKPHARGMGSYPTSSYEAGAKKVPAELATALWRDVHLTPAQYLANSAAAVQGVKVVAALKSSGVAVLGSKMDGTRLIVNVASAADVRSVQALGGTAVIGKPKTKDLSAVEFQSVAATNTYGGEGYFFSGQPGGTDGDGFRCSIGFNGYAVSTGASQFVTAGHCETAMPAGNSAFFLDYNKPDGAGGSASEGAALGTGVAGQYGNGNPSSTAPGEDYGIIGTDTTAFSPQNSVATWGYSTTGAPISSTPQGITGESAGIVNATLCKTGSTTGWTCGTIEAVDTNVPVSGEYVNAIVATTCLLPGDSGGGALIGVSTAVGIDSGASFPDGQTPSCANSQGSVFFPMVSTAGNDSVQGQQGANWQLGLAIAAPVVTYPSTNAVALVGRSMTGTLASAPADSTVSLYIDGSTTAFATGSSSSGSWTIPLNGLATGRHSYSLVAKSGWSVGTSATGSFTVVTPVGPTVSGGVGDFNGDGNTDVVVRDSNGTLWLYPGNGRNGFLTRVQLATGWSGMNAISPAGDLNGDGHQDIVARDSAGTLWLYPGNGSNALMPRVQLGAASAWLSMTSIEGVADFNGDGHADLMARDTSGVLWLYPGTGSNTLSTRVQVLTGLQSTTALVGVGDFNKDGKADILVRNSSGTLLMYPGNGSGGLNTPVQVGTGWQGITIAAVGDFNNDGTEDLLMRDAVGGLWVYPGSGTGALLARFQIGTGWQGLTIAGDADNIAALRPPIPVYLSGGVGDFNSDGNPDIVMRDGNGALWLYPGNGSNAVTPRTSLGSAGTWASMTALVPVGDFTGDGKPDLMGRDKSGNLMLFAGDGGSALGTGVQVGANTTWAGMTSIQGVGDLTGDHKPDVVARDTAGNLWLYPNNGSGTGFGAATKIGDASVWNSMTGILGAGDWNLDGNADLVGRDSSGNLLLFAGDGAGHIASSGTLLGTGWQGLTIISVGDFNGDGTEDILIRDTVGSLYLYPGNGNGGFSPRTLLGTGWQGLTLAGSSDSIAAVPIPKPPIPVYLSGGVGDFNSDGNPDIVMRDGNGALWLYPGNGSNAVLPRTSLGSASTWATMSALVPVGDFSGDGHPDLMGRTSTGTLDLFTGNGSSTLGSASPIGTPSQFANMTAIQGVGDLNGDQKPDVIMRDSVGTLWFYPNNGSNGFGTPAQIGLAGAWASFTGFLGAGDWNLDGKADLVARDSSGVLWMYPGNGDGTVGSRVQLGTGWQGITVISVGDFNGDGTEDILIRDANGVLFLYPGNGSGFSPRIQLGTGWQGLTMAGNMDTIAAVTG